MAHLAGSVDLLVAVLEKWWVGGGDGASALDRGSMKGLVVSMVMKYIGATTKIESCNIDSSELKPSEGPAEAQYDACCCK